MEILISELKIFIKLKVKSKDFYDT